MLSSGFDNNGKTKNKLHDVVMKRKFYQYFLLVLLGVCVVVNIILITFGDK